MEKIYLNYPYLTELTTKTKEKWVEDDELHVIFEQTLFFADENVHIEQGKIDDIPTMISIVPNSCWRSRKEIFIRL